jgi:hypothetical protein
MGKFDISTTKQPPHSDSFAQKVSQVSPRPVNSLIYNELQRVILSKKVSPKCHKYHPSGNVSRWFSNGYVFFYKLITNAPTHLQLDDLRFTISLCPRCSPKRPTQLEFCVDLLEICVDLLTQKVNADFKKVNAEFGKANNSLPIGSQSVPIGNRSAGHGLVDQFVIYQNSPLTY